MTDNLTYAYLGGLTSKRGEDGFLYVTGLVSDDTLDLDQQRCDPTWLKSAIPAWFDIGNVREMHSSKAVGKATEIEQSGTGWRATVKVVDSDTAMKVEHKVLTGMSIGIKNARVIKSDMAPNGIINSGDVVEVSLVDRPANPSCVIEIAKSVDGELVKGYPLIEEMTMTEPAGAPTEVYDRTIQCEYCNGTGQKVIVGETTESCDICGGTGLQPDEMPEDDPAASPTIPQDVDENDSVTRSVDAETVPDVQMVQDDNLTVEVDKSDALIPDGDVEIVQEPVIETAELGVDVMAFTGLGVSADLIKSASADDATPESRDELRAEIVKALGLEDITTKAELSEAKEEIELLKAALEEVKAMAAPTSISLRATSEQTQKSAQATAYAVEAQRLRMTAAQIVNPDLRNQYLDSATQYENLAATTN